MDLSIVNIVILSLIILWIFAGAHLLRPISAKYRARRILFLVLSLAGFILMVFKPYINRKTTKKSVLLVHKLEGNESFSKKKYDRVFQNFYEYLTSEFYLRKDSLTIMGNGLEPEDLSLIKDIPKKVVLKDVRGGFTEVQVPLVKSYRPFQITGSVDQVNAKGVKVVTPDGTEYYSPLQDLDFTIELQAQEPGPFIYDLHLIGENDTLCEKLPIVIEEDTPWKILILNSSPSFEHNFLKNHFGEQGKQFTIRQKISKDKYQYSYTNTERHSIFPLTKTSLLRYDFCLIDVATWNSVGSDNRKSILEEVKNRGLSLLIKPSNGMVARDIPKYRVQSSESISWQEDNREVEINSTRLSSTSAYQEITSQGHIIGYQTNYGIGKIGIVGMEATYLLLLNEMENSYQKIWTDFLSVFYTPTQETSIIKTPFWNFRNTSIPVQVITSEDKPQLILNDSIRLAMQESPFVADYYSARTFADDGWHYLNLTSDTLKHWFYVHPDSTWKVQRSQNLKLINERALATSSVGDIHIERVPIPWYWGLLLCVLGLGLLWLDERIYD